ncbi:MAG: PAS domain S-box protein [Microscillaceae bacterium]|nr:PAS domain S-box protein [Microscillaceae bacterium]
MLLSEKKALQHNLAFWHNLGYTKEVKEGFPLVPTQEADWQAWVQAFREEKQMEAETTWAFVHFQGHTLPLKCQGRIALLNEEVFLLLAYSKAIAPHPALYALPALPSTEFENFFFLQHSLLNIATLTGHLLTLNEAWESTLGYTHEELTSVSFLNFIHPDDISATSLAMHELQKKGRLTGFRNRYRTKSGHYRVLEWDSTVQGQFIYSVARDITEMAEAEQTLKEKEALLQNLSQTLPGLFLRYRLRPNGHEEILYISERVYSIYGLTVAEALANPQKVWEKIFPEDIPAFQESIQHSAQNLSFWRHEWRIKTLEKQTKWLMSQGAPNREADGSTVWHTLILDISDLKALQAQIQAQLDIHQGVLDSFKDAIFSLDTQQRYTSFNEAHRRKMKAIYGVEIALGAVALDYLPKGPVREAAMDNNARVLLGESLIETAKLEEEAFEKRFYDITQNPIRNADSQVVGIAFLANDTTEKTKNAQALKESLERLALIGANFPEGSISLIDRDLNILYSDGRGYQDYSDTPKQITGKKLSEILSPKNFKKILALLPKVWAGKLAITEYEYSEKIYEITMQPVLNEGNEVNLFVLTAVDITYRKQAENALLEKIMSCSP